MRLLYRFDPLLLATRDKSWLIDAEHYKKVWRPSAHVAAVLLVGGRIAGTWRYDRKAKGLDIAITPFSRLTRRVVAAVEKQAAGVAGFFALPLKGVEIVADETEPEGRSVNGKNRRAVAVFAGQVKDKLRFSRSERSDLAVPSPEQARRAWRFSTISRKKPCEIGRRVRKKRRRDT